MSMRVSAIDFETANDSPCSICAVGIVTLNDGVFEDEYYSLIKPTTRHGWFSGRNVAIHGIHPEDVLDAPYFRDIYPDVALLIKDSLVCAHNASFDMGCLNAVCLEQKLPNPVSWYFDTVQLSRRAFPDMPHHRLNDMCERLSIHLDHHQALSDARGCLLIVERLMTLSGIYDPLDLLVHYRTRIVRL